MAVNPEGEYTKDHEQIAKGLSEGLYPYHLEWLPLEDLFTDDYVDKLGLGNASKDGYQRVTTKIVKRMVSDGLNPNLFQPITANRRTQRGISTKRTVAVLDGGTRIRALGPDGFNLDGKTLIPTLVFSERLSQDQEAWVFLHMNADRQGLTAVDLWVGAIACGDQKTVRMDEMVRTITGRSVGPKPHQLQCVRSITDLYAFGDELYEGEALRTTLEILTEAQWINDPKECKKNGKSYRGDTSDVVGGVGLLVRQALDAYYGTWDGKVVGEDFVAPLTRTWKQTEDYFAKLAKLMKKYGSEAIYDEAGVKATNSRTRSKMIARVLALHMNYRVNPGSVGYTSDSRWLI